MGATGLVGLGSLAGCLGNLNETNSQGGTQQGPPLTTAYTETDHLYDLPSDPLTAAIPEPPDEPLGQGEMNLYMSQMMFLQNVYLRETAYALRRLALLEEIPTAPWVTDDLDE